MPFAKKEQEAPETPVAETSSWTGGGVWAARGATIGLWALLLVYPVAVTLAISGANTPSNAAPTEVNAVRAVSEQSAGAVASGFVAAWLSAVKDDSTELQRYVSTMGMDLPENGWAFRNLAVASVGEATSTGLVPVQIAADIEETSIEGEDPVTAWQRRYFTVTVRVDGAALAVVGMPSPIASPPTPADGPRLDYGTSIPLSSPVSATAASFLAAYLTGNGEVGRYVTPGVEMTAITPAPFSAVALKDVTADVNPEENAADGSELHVSVEVELVSGTGQKIRADYALSMTARADRWEVTSIDPTPAEKPSIRP